MNIIMRWCVAGLLLWAGVLLGSRPLWAHEGHSHVMGTVIALSDGRMAVRMTDGSTVTILVDRNTRFRATGVATNSGTVAVGDRVVVEVADEEASGLRAAEVRYAAAAPAHP